jgi:hypothetical protein
MRIFKMDTELNEIITGKMLGFLKEMYEWELFCKKVGQDTELTFEEQVSKQKELIIKILQKYCTQKDRLNGKPNVISYGNYIDEHEEKILEIIQEKENRICVYTQGATGETGKYLYILIKIKGEWLIDSKKRYSGFKNKWVVYNL